jgi:hypothetical protein
METPISHPPKNDAIIPVFKDALEIFQTYASVINIAESHSGFKYPIALEMAKCLKQGLRLDVLNMDLTVILLNRAPLQN